MSAVSDYNRNVSGWSRDTLRKTKNRTLRLVLNIGPGYNNQKVGTKLYMGEANKITFSFPYYMVFVHKGAGRGYGGIKTGLFTTSKGTKGITNPASMGKMGTGKRRPKPWFNPVIEEQFPALSDIVSDYQGEKITLNIKRILID
jgi:hypothetical protein